MVSPNAHAGLLWLASPVELSALKSDARNCSLSLPGETCDRNDGSPPKQKMPRCRMRCESACRSHWTKRANFDLKCLNCVHWTFESAKNISVERWNSYVCLVRSTIDLTYSDLAQSLERKRCSKDSKVDSPPGLASRRLRSPEWLVE